MVTSWFSCDKQESDAVGEKEEKKKGTKRGLIRNCTVIVALAQIPHVLLSTHRLNLAYESHRTRPRRIIWFLRPTTEQLTANQFPQHFGLLGAQHFCSVRFNTLIQTRSCPNTSFMSTFKCAEVIRIQELTTSLNKQSLSWSEWS